MGQKEGSPPVLGHLFIIIGAVLWGTSGTVQALAPAAATPQVIGTFRILISGIFILSLTLIKGTYGSWRAFFQPLFLLTGLCQATFQLTYFGGIAHTGVAVGTMVAIGSAPIFTGLLGVVFDREKIKARWIIATLVALVGVGMLFLGDAGAVQVDALGILLAAGAGFSYALFTLLASKFIRHSNSDVVISSSFLVGSIYLSPMLFLYPVAWIGSGPGFMSILYLGFISAGVAYMFYGRGLKTVPVSTIGTLTLAEPLTAALLGIFFLGEELLVSTAFGIFLIFAAQVVIVAERRQIKRNGAPRPSSES